MQNDLFKEGRPYHFLNKNEFKKLSCMCSRAGGADRRYGLLVSNREA